MAETDACDDKYGHEYHRLRSLTGAYEIRQHSVSKSDFQWKETNSYLDVYNTGWC